MNNQFYKNILGFTFGLLFFLPACTLVKHHPSSDFRRNKYRSHLEIGKQQLKSKKEVISQKSESTTLEASTSNTPIAFSIQSKPIRLLEEVMYIKKPKVPRHYPMVEEHIFNSMNDKFNAGKKGLNNSSKLPSSFNKSDGWWEEDPENWPWKELILAAILVILIIVIIVLLFELLGALLGSLFGLILLLLLIYLLLVYVN